MKYQRLLLAFVTISAVSFLYEKYKSKYEESPEKKNFSLIEKHLLKNAKNGKPNIWIHTDYNVNARNKYNKTTYPYPYIWYLIK